MKSFVPALCILIFVVYSPVMAVEVEGVLVEDSVSVEGKELLLNGAGVRTKFFFDIYVAALYLPEKSTDVFQIVKNEQPKRIWMHFLYDKVSREKLVDGWASGFKKNSTKADFEQLEPRLNQFNAMFTVMHKNEEITFDFLDDGEVQVMINDEKKGVVTGKDFQQALLKVWLGEKPADKGLKKALSGL